MDQVTRVLSGLKQNKPPPNQPVQLLSPTDISSPSYRYAGFVGRLIALLLDGVISVMLIFVLMLFLIYLTPLVPYEKIKFIGMGIILFTFPLYNTILIHRFKTTVGKNILGYRVISVSGKTLSFFKIFLRESLGKYLSFSLLGLGFFWVLFDPKKQGWHDKIFETYVVKQPQVPLARRILVFLGTPLILLLVFIATLKAGQITGLSRKITTLPRDQFNEQLPTVSKEPKTDSQIVAEAQRTGNHLLCKKIKDPSLLISCIQNISEGLITEEFCNDLERENVRNLCFSSAASTKKDTVICSKITDSYEKNLCILKIAAELKDVSLCELVSKEANYYERCVREVGQALKDITYCERLTSTTEKDNCYDALATYLLCDRALCEKIFSPEMKSYCFEWHRLNPTYATCVAKEKFVLYCCKVKYACPDNSTIYTYLKNHPDNKERLDKMSTGPCKAIEEDVLPDTLDYKDEQCAQIWHPHDSCK